MDPIARYTPKKLDDTVNIKARIEMCDWLESWETKRKVDSVKNAVLLHGPSGTGKTFIMNVISKRYSRVLHYNDIKLLYRGYAESHHNKMRCLSNS